MSAETHAELLEVLGRDYWLETLAPVEAYVAEIKNRIDTGAQFYLDLPEGPFPIEDPKDEKFLALAQASNADYIVSGDKHLRKLRSFMGTTILTPREFLDVIEARNDGPPQMTDSE